MTFFRYLLLSGLLLTGCVDSASGVENQAVWVRLSACTNRPLGPGLLQLHPELRTDELGICIGSAPDCDTYLSCIGVDVERPCVFAEGHRCEGNVAVTCSESGFERDEVCEGRNPICDLDEHGIPQCRSGDSCADQGAHCDNNVIVSCFGGFARRFSCDDLTCVEGPGGLVLGTPTESSAFCVEEVRECEADRCDGDTLVRCVEGLGVRTQDCALLFADGRCMEEAGVADCARQEVVCEEGEVRCDGDDAQACVRGGWETFPCSEFEGSRCVTDEETISCVR